MSGDALSWVLFPVRTGLNIGALLAIGLALHAALGVVERDAHTSVRVPGFVAATFVVIFAFARLAVLNLQMGDGTTLFDPDILSLSWTTLGPSTLTLLAGSGAVAVGLALASRPILAAGALTLATGFALTGHTQGLDDPGPAPLVVSAHVLIAGFWIAAPVTLYPATALSNQALHARLARFSAIAVVGVPFLVLLGGWLAWRLAGGFMPLVSSAYGLLLLLKLGAALVAMAIGALNQQVVTAKVLADPGRGRRWLRWTLTTESTLFLMAVVAVSAATTIAAPGE